MSSVDVVAAIYDSMIGYVAVAIAGSGKLRPGLGSNCLTCQLVIEGNLMSTSHR